MDYPIRFGLPNATAAEQVQLAEQLVDSAWLRVRPELVELVRSFLVGPLSPTTFFAFEMALLTLVRQLGRVSLEGTINACQVTIIQLRGGSSRWGIVQVEVESRENVPAKYYQVDVVRVGYVVVFRFRFDFKAFEEVSFVPFQLRHGA